MSTVTLPPRVAIVGGGPAGLATSLALSCAGVRHRIYAPSLGGRYISSPRLENVPGFPLGIRGQLFADRLIEQAFRLGLRYTPSTVDAILPSGDGRFMLSLEDGRLPRPPYDAVVVATGITMNLPPAGIPSSTFPSSPSHAVVVGSGDAAVQVALGHASQGIPTILATKGDLGTSCSPYLRARIARHPALSVMGAATVTVTEDEVVATTGMLSRHTPRATTRLEWLVGGHPTASRMLRFLPPSTLDARGFIHTAPDYQLSPGMWVAGDARVGSIKRIAVAMGEGSAAGWAVAKWVTGRAQAKAA